MHCINSDCTVVVDNDVRLLETQNNASVWKNLGVQ